MPSSDGPMLDAVGLQRSFGALRVLRGVDVRVHGGEALVVAGPNGAGKTTLLRLLAGLARPTAGEVRVAGRRLDPSDPDSRRPIGFVSHQSMLYDDLTLRENVALAARLYGVPHPGDAASRAIELVGLGGQGDERPPRLSRGLLQRASIARALVHEPRLLLLDEPFTGLDAPSAERLRSLLRARLSAGLALVLVTHHLDEAWGLASRVAVLAEGRWALDEPRAGDLDQFLPRYHALANA